MNILERVIAFVSPEWAYKREQWRQGLKALRNYDSGRVDRLQAWTPVNASAEATDAPYRDILRARARALERNSDSAGAVLTAILSNVVGTGIKPQARIKKNNGEYDERLNNELESAWKEWVKHKNCDISGQNTFYELQSLLLRRRIIDGEVFVRLVTTKDSGSVVPLKIQGLEADLLDTYKTKGDAGTVIAGVEIDAYYRPLAYWFKTLTPDGYTTFDSIRVPANEIIHLFTKVRFNQVRGVSEFARIIQRMKEAGDYLDAELVAAKIAACFALFIRKERPSQSAGRLPIDNDDKRVLAIEPGMIHYLQPGEDITAANPGRNATTVKDFIEIEDRRIAADQGISYELLTRDMSKTNYSSARQNHLQDRKTFIPMQRYLVNHLCEPVWEAFVEHCVLTGIVNIPDFFVNRARYLACDWIAPGWQWIDPLKDVKARREEIDAGLSTLAQTCAEQGYDWQEIVDQLAREQKYAKAKGVELNTMFRRNERS